MAHFAAKYQLNNVKNYEPLWDEMRRLGAHKAMRTLYLLDYPGTAAQLGQTIAPFLDDDDMLFVSELKSAPYSRKCFQGTKAWIDARF
jgi:hypothetical protein